MGQITIEIPQKINKYHRITSEDSAEKILLYLEKLVEEGILEEVFSQDDIEK